MGNGFSSEDGSDSLRSSQLIPNARSVRGTNTLCEIEGIDREKSSIRIDSIHISCQSDIHDPKKHQAGLIVYSYKGKTDFYLNGKHCRSGYILIKNAESLENIDSNKGQVHGKLFKWFFGIEPDNDFVGAGFAYHEGKWKFNSYTYNGNDKDGYHDNDKGLHRYEETLLGQVIHNLYVNNKWQSRPTMSIENLCKFSSSSAVPAGNLFQIDTCSII